MKYKSFVILLGVLIGLFPSLAVGADDFYVIPVRSGLSDCSDCDGYFVARGGDTITGGLNVMGGSVGIGTTTPTNRLHVTSGGTPGRFEFSGTGSHAVLHLDCPDILASRFSRLDWRSKNSVGETPQFAGIEVHFQDKTDDSEDADMTFSTMENGNLTEKVRILSNGNIGIGTTNPEAPLTVRRPAMHDGAISGINMSGFGGFGVRGESFATGNYGYLGGEDYAVYGETLSGLAAGKFVGNVSVEDGHLDISGVGNDTGGSPGHNEVVGHFKHEASNRHSAISVDADSARDAIVYLARGGEARWDLRNDADASDQFQLRYHGGGTSYVVFFVDSNGLHIKRDLDVQKAYTGSFPRPAWDSGWSAIASGEALELEHDIGGNPDNYVVDMQFKGSTASQNYGIHHHDYGTDVQVILGETERSGAFWRNLTSTHITVERRSEDEFVDQVRVRIWVYK